MQLEHILLFYKIANEKSISKVASSNHISQPALSQQMQKLEEEVGQRLLERSNRGIELTSAGVIMQKYAAQFLQLYDNLQEDLENLQANFGTVRITATSVAASYALPCSLFKVKQRFPVYNFSLNAINSAEVINRVKTGATDIGFVVGKTDEPDIICTEAFSDKIYLVAKADYNIKDNILKKELYKYPLIMLNESFSSYRLVKEYIIEQGIAADKLKIMCHLDSTESVKSAVMSQHGLAFLPYMAMKKELYQKQLKIINLEDFDLNYDVYSIHRTKAEIGNDKLYEVIKYFITTVNKSIC